MCWQDARGDQCDNCGNLLNPTELLNPKCKFTGTTPVLRPTRHLYIDLPKLTPQLQKYIDATSQLGGWSTNCVQVSGRCSHRHAGHHNALMPIPPSLRRWVILTAALRCARHCHGSQLTSNTSAMPVTGYQWLDEGWVAAESHHSRPSVGHSSASAWL